MRAYVRNGSRISRASHLCHQRSCKPNTSLIDWHPSREIVLKEVPSRWRRPCHAADISYHRKRPQPNNEKNIFLVISSVLSRKFFRLGLCTEKQETYPTMTDLLRHADLLNCVKLPRVLASLSRHSNCYVALQLLLAARLAVSRSLPSTLCCKLKSITPINLAGERNGDGDCFAWVQTNAVFFPFSVRTHFLWMSTGGCIFSPFLAG